MENYEIIVIGGGPAGITFAKMLGGIKKIAIIRPEDYSMIYCAMPYAIEGLIKAEKTFKNDSLVTDSGATLIRDSVNKIEFDKKVVSLESGSELSYEKLIISTGATPFIPPIAGSKLKGVGGFKTQKDLTWVHQLVDDGLKKAVVVGAGAIGIELAQAFSFRKVPVDLVDMGDSVLPNLVDKEMSIELAKELKEDGINLILESKVTELKGTTFVEEVILDNGKSIKFGKQDDKGLSGVVVFAAGMSAELALVKDSIIEYERGGIVINNKMETSLKDVYAVGDCTQFKSGITGKIVPGKLATNAVPMAKVLAFNLKGGERFYPGFYNGAATKVGKFFVGGTGLSEKAAKLDGYSVVIGYSEVTTKFPIMPDAKRKKMKLIADSKTHKILGAQIISEEPVVGRIDLLTFAIQKETTVEEMTTLSYASQPHQSFYPAANIVVLAAEDIRKKMKW